MLDQALRTNLALDSTCKCSLKTFMESKEAMELAVELNSKLRKQGDHAAHHASSKAQFSASVEQYRQNGGDRGDGLKILVDFLFPC